MRDAVLQDMLNTGINDIVITKDQRLSDSKLPIQCITIAGDPYPIWQSCMDNADYVLLIAPESEDILLRLTRMAEGSAGHILGSASASIKTASSKLATTKLLRKNNIPCVPTALLEDHDIAAGQNNHSIWVVKPDDGVGGDGCHLYNGTEIIDRLKKSTEIGSLIIQQYIAGDSASLSMLCHRGEAQLLACNRQIIAFDQQCYRLKKIIVNGLVKHWDTFNDIAQRIAAADHGLSGYIGVDMMITESDFLILEINPRLTTSYAGLQQSLACNPAALILSIYKDQKLPQISAHQQFVPVEISLQAGHGS